MSIIQGKWLYLLLVIFSLHPEESIGQFLKRQRALNSINIYQLYDPGSGTLYHLPKGGAISFTKYGSKRKRIPGTRKRLSKNYMSTIEFEFRHKHVPQIEKLTQLFGVEENFKRVKLKYGYTQWGLWGKYSWWHIMPYAALQYDLNKFKPTLSIAFPIEENHFTVIGGIELSGQVRINKRLFASVKIPIDVLKAKFDRDIIEDPNLPEELQVFRNNRVVRIDDWKDVNIQLGIGVFL